MQNDDSEIIVSIVIPIYNAGVYIVRCIESLKAQSMKELEFIFVDDCSEDESMEPVNEWASADPRVKVVRNEQNLGEGGSRNRGIEAAQGIYINTIDPDDWVAPDYYELLYTKAEQTGADIVKGTRIKHITIICKGWGLHLLNILLRDLKKSLFLLVSKWTIF